jgi:OmpA-OmpF porin, OOP family
MTSDGPEEILELEGRIRWDGFVSPSNTSEIMAGRSYEAALEEAGFEMLFSCIGEECGNLLPFIRDRSFRDMADPVRDVSAGYGWKFLAQHNDRARYYLARRESDEGVAHALVHISRHRPQDRWVMIGQIIVESAPLEMRPIEAVVRKAGQLWERLEDDGRVVVPGIFFDTNSAVLRSESHAAVEQVAELMRNVSEMRVHIVGHTDNQGSLEYNRNLSEQRARAVRQALIGDHGIDGARMIALGVGFAAPVASNGTDEGRALNRRVELVRAD